MPEIDNKVVSIEFDNSSFERKVAGTMASLDKLKASLAFNDANKSFADLDSSVKKINFGSMASAVDGISTKFIALSTIAITALSNITNKAVDTGIRLAKSLSIDQVLSGFSEYETNMNSIQTILANTTSDGTNLKDVTAALDELNTYSDQTIYNFSEMARNIGTFTAAGVDLDTSTNAIKGIANLAAISGSNSQQAATAMYQLSQAISTGTVRLMDWNSVVNAGMGGEVFQKALFESGKALGTIKDITMDTTFEEWTSAGNSFRGSLESGWLTAEVLTNTLSGFTGDLSEAQILALGYTKEQAAEIMKMGQMGQDAATKVKTLTQLIGTVKEAIGSGWSKSFQIIFGDFEEARTLFTGISEAVGDIVTNSADSRNNMLESWKDMGGRTLLIKSLQTAFEGLSSILRPIQNAFRDIFPPVTAETLLKLTSKFFAFTKKLQITGYTAYKIHAIFEGFFSVLRIGWEVISNGARAFKELFNYFTDGGKGILDLGVSLGDFFSGLKEKLVDGGGITKFFDDLIEAIKNPAAFIDKLKAKFKSFFKGINFGTIDGLVEAFVRIKDSIIETISGLDLGVFDGVQNFFSSIFEKFDPNFTNSMDGGFNRLGDRFSWFGDILSKLKDVVSSAGDVLGNLWDKTMSAKDRVVEAISNIGGAFEGFGPALLKFFESDNFDKTLELIQTIIAGMFAGGFNKIATDGLDIDLTGGALTGLGDMFKGITNTMPAVTNSLNSLSGTLKAMQTKLRADALMKIAIAIGILTASVVILSMIDTEALIKAMSALAVGFTQLIGAFAVINQLASGTAGGVKFGAVAAGLLLISGALLVLSIAVKILATMSWEELAKGLSATVGLLAALVAAVNLMPSDGKMISSGLAIIAIAVAMNILAIAMKIFATMSWEEMGKGLTGVAGSLGAIVLAMNLMPSKSKMLTTGLGILAIAFAMNLLAGAMKIFATMSWEEMGKGLAAVAAGLLIIAGAMNLMPLSMVLLGPALIGVAFALNILAGALLLMATMSWEEFGKSMAVLASSLGILALALHLMSGSILGAVALGVAAVSLGLLAKVLQQFGKMKLKDIGKGLLGLAGILAVLGIGAALMTPILGPLLVLGAALFLVGAGLALFGLGASLAAGAFVALAAAGEAGISVLLLLLDALIQRLPEIGNALVLTITTMITTLGGQAPVIIEQLLGIVAQLLEGFVSLAPQLITAINTLVDIILTVLIEKGPDIIAAGLTLLLNLLQGILDNIGQIVTTVADIIITFLNALTEKMPDIVAAGLSLLTSFLQGIADNIPDVVQAGVDIIVSIIQGITDSLDDIITAATDLVTTFITSLGGAALDIIAAGTQVITNIIAGIGDAADDVIQAGVDTVLSFLDGVADNALELADGAAKIVTSFLNGLADAIDKNAAAFRNAGLNIAGSILDGVLFGLPGKVKDALGFGKEVANGIVGGMTKELEVKSPSRVMIRIGDNVMDGLAIGIRDNTKPFQTADKMTSDLVGGIQETLMKLPNLVGNISEFSPTITPVLDLTGVQKDAKAISTFMGNQQVTAGLSLDQAQAISFVQNSQNGSDSQTDQQPGTTNIVFNQTNNSPEPLSTSAIYRQTRSQLATTKIKLGVPG